MTTDLERAQGEDALTTLIVDSKVKGKSFAAIASENGMAIDEVIAIYRGFVQATAIRDPQEYRMLLQLRVEKVIEHLWNGLESGSFKHGEAILKAVNTLQELHDLNEKTIVHQINVILDEDAAKVFDIMKLSHASLLNKLTKLPLNAKAKEALKEWPEWAAESATEAVEQVIYLSQDEEDGVYK